MDRPKVADKVVGTFDVADRYVGMVEKPRL
jgi:hypothetical protein